MKDSKKHRMEGALTRRRRDVEKHTATFTAAADEEDKKLARRLRDIAAADVAALERKLGHRVAA